MNICVITVKLLLFPMGDYLLFQAPDIVLSVLKRLVQDTDMLTLFLQRCPLGGQLDLLAVLRGVQLFVWN